MATQYFRLSDLGEADMTFDAETPPQPEKRKRIAEPTREEIEVEERRKKGGAKRPPRPSVRLRSDPRDDRGNRETHEPVIEPGEGYPIAPPGAGAGSTVDDILYGGPPPPSVVTGPGIQGYPVMPGPPLTEKSKEKVIDYLPYIAGIAILGFLIFFLVQKRRME